MQSSVRVLLTGYDPYGGFDVNPSREVALSLHQREIGRATVNSLILPVSFKRVFEVLRRELDTGDRPGAIISLGLLPFASAIQIERIAINLIDHDGVPDNDGATPQDETIIRGAPAAYFSTLPIRKIVENLSKSGIPTVISNSAGTHLCNFIMYNVLNYVSQRAWNVPAGFIHLPLLPQQVQKIMHKPQNTPSLPLEVMTNAIQISIQIISEILLRTRI